VETLARSQQSAWLIHPREVSAPLEAELRQRDPAAGHGSAAEPLSLP
jgi:hypothetical protein